MTKKIYVLDTNVLIHDPMAIQNFEENDVLIPMTVLEELDHLKNSKLAVGADSRQAIRSIDKILNGATPEEVERGVAIKNAHGDKTGGTMRVLMPGSLSAIGSNLREHLNDNIIINELVALKEKLGAQPIILVSKDINMRLKSRACGVHAEDYQNDQVVKDIDKMSPGYHHVQGNIWEQFSEVKSRQHHHTMAYQVPITTFEHLQVNEFIVDDEGFVGRVDERKEDELIIRHISRSAIENREAWGLKPRNLEQGLALDLLLDNDIHLVSLTGPAGSGKTILAVAAALELTGEQGHYRRIIVTRSTPPLAEDIGFLPGTEQEKMDPWLGGIADNIEALHKEDENQHGSIQYLLEKIPIQFKSINYLRGRSFQNSFIVIDECQNLSPHQIKTVITRAGEGSKVVCLGNLAQIDTPYLNPNSSGLTTIADRFRGFNRSGNIQLTGVPRSELAAFAESAL